MDDDYPELLFDFEYAGKLRQCKVVMTETSYHIYFDGQYIADITMDDHWQWTLSGGGILPNETIDQIGLMIEGLLE